MTENIEEDTPIEESNLPERPKHKVEGILDELQMLAIHNKGRSKGGLDLSNFLPEQNDKLLEILSKNEDNAFQFHTKRLEYGKEIELKRIEAATVNQRTIRVILIAGLLIVLPVISLLILFFKENFFLPWLTFLTGLAGGFGLGKTTKLFNKEPGKNPLIEDQEE